MNKFDWFKGKFEFGLSNEKQVDIFNRYCKEYNIEDEIYPMCEFDEIFSNKKPSEIFQMVQSNDGVVNDSDDYFVVTINGFQTSSDPYEFIQDYLSDIFNHMHIWKTNINLDDYIQDMYDAHFDLKPEDMDEDDFYDIVEDAVDSYDIENDIVDWIKKSVSEE